MTDGNGKGDKVRISMSTLAVILSICGPVSFGAVAEYRLQQTEEALVDMRTMMIDQDRRMRLMEIAVDRSERNSEIIRQQSAQIASLGKEIQELSRQVDRQSLRIR